MWDTSVKTRRADAFASGCCCLCVPCIGNDGRSGSPPSSSPSPPSSTSGAYTSASGYVRRPRSSYTPEERLAWKLKRKEERKEKNLLKSAEKANKAAEQREAKQKRLKNNEPLMADDEYEELQMVAITTSSTSSSTGDRTDSINAAETTMGAAS